MGSFRYLLLSLLAFLIVFTVTSCDDGGSTTKTVECAVPTECKANQDCVFDSLTAEKGVCTNRVVCEANTDCSDGLLCADDAGSKFCGTREVFGIKSITLDDAKKDEFYPIVKLEVTGSQAEYSFEVLDSTKLPAGLELSPEGNLSGTITADIGEYTFTVKATNGPKDAAHYYNYREATEELTIKVVEGAVTCKVDSCTEAHKTVCSVENDAIVCSCDTGYQDNDDNGTCEETCGMSNLGCTDTQHCDDTAGTATCVCNENWQDDGNGGKCNVCVAGMHINPDDATVCDPDVRTVTCTNIPDATVATWADAFDNGDFEQTWINGEYIPNVDPDKCLWKCTDSDKVHDVDANVCICGSGLVDDDNGGCKTPCLDNQISNADGTCSCYPGYGGDDCLACATGYNSSRHGLCIFDCSDKANTHVNDNNDNCVCDNGYFDDGSGNCVNPCEGDNAPNCGDTKVCVAVDATQTNCVCDAGLNFVDDGSGNCGCDTANTHRVLATTGDSCECDSANNYVEDLDGTCSLDTACTVDSFTSADPVNDTYATAADITSELVDSAVHYDDLNNQAVDCSSSEDWYKVTVPANKKLSVNINFVNADGNLDLKLYVGGDGYDDDIETSNWSSGDEELVEHVFREETDVYIKVYGPTYSLVRNTYSMDVKLTDIAPVSDLDGGDTCADAVEITQSGTYHGTTAGKTDSMDSPCSSDQDAPEVFYKITPTTDVTLKAKVEKEFYDGIIYLIDSCASTDSIACNDGFSSDKITADLVAGTTYYLVIDGYHSESGEFNLDVELIGPEAPIVCDPACDVDKETCSDVEGTPTCTCDADKGYFYNGFTCVNPCLSASCDSKSNSTCIPSSAMDYTCECDDGYTELNGACLQEQAFPGGDTCGDGLPEITETGIYTGSVNTNDTTVECGYDDGNDVFYKLVLTEESYVNITETEDFDTFNATMALRESCDATTDLACESLDTTGVKGFYPAGTYYLVIEGAVGDVNYSLNVIINPNPCIGVTCDGSNESGVCTPSDDQNSYTCECNDNYFKDEDGNCLSPCDTAVCPGDTANGTGCIATSLTDYSCGCADNYFEVIATDGTRTCESGCEVTALDCSAEGNNVECRSTSATEAECGCEFGYVDADATDAFNCVAITNGGDTCSDAVNITEGTYYGSTEGFNNDYTNEATCITENEKGNDVVYSVEVPAGYTLSATLDADVTWVGLYLLDDCSTMNCLVANSTATQQPPVTIEHTNTTDAPITLFMVLDSYTENQSMNYQLDVILTPPPHCGNGTIDTDEGEDCDPNAADPLDGATCSLGGDLACDSECHFDRTQCWECDGTDDATQCTEAGKPLCYTDTHTCGAAQAECGNNTIESPEECDGTAVFDTNCPAGMAGTKTCVAAGETNECTIDDSGCAVCEDTLTLNSDSKNSDKDNALELSLTNNEGSWDNLTTSVVGDTNTCDKVEDWYKVTVPANHKISVDILFTDADGDLDLNLYEGISTSPVGGSYGSGHSGSTTDNEHVDNSDEVKDTETIYYIQVKYGQNIYNMKINIVEICTVDTDCSTTGDVCLSGACYDSTPCSDTTICDSKSNSTCVATSNVDYTCECDDTYTELDGQCLLEQTLNGANTCGDTLPEITETSILTGSVTSDDTTLGCSSGSNEVFYKVVLAEDSYLKVTETEDYSDFNANLALRTTCDDVDNDLECNAYGDEFDGFYSAGTYYLVVEGYSSSSVNYRLEVTIKSNPCNGVTCDAVNGTGTCVPSSDALNYTCECNEGYFFDGNNACVTPCATDTCDSKPNSTCKATNATDFTCECNDGYLDDNNGTCVDVCAGNSCDATTEVCVPVDASNYNCECADSYISDGNGGCVADLGVDTCTDANLYTINASGTFYGTTNGAATDYDCGSGSGHDVVYAIDLNVDDQLDVTLSSTQDTVLFLMKTCSNEATNCLVEEDSGFSGDDESFSFTATEAATYIIGLRRYGATADMDYSLTVDLTPSTTAANVGWCNTQSPEATAAQGETVYGRVYVAGVTDGAGQGANVDAQLCYYADGDTIDNSVCSSATYNVDDANNDEYMDTLPSDFADGVYHYYFRFKASGDADYLPCDLNNTTAGTNGTDYQNAATYQGDTGTLTISTQHTALVSNGDFEAWTGANPNEWTTIDSGLSLTQEQTIIHGGASSMAVTQGSNKQDFRQDITTVAGTTYNVSVWVYTPTGTDIKARIYAGDYRNYSDNTILDSWQEVTTSFTATDTTTQVGLRFYNTTGTLYIDDYTVVAQ